MLAVAGSKVWELHLKTVSETMTNNRTTVILEQRRSAAGNHIVIKAAEFCYYVILFN